MIEELEREIDRLVEADPATLADSDTILALSRQLSRLEAVAARSTAAWDAKQAWAPDGARNGVAWLTAKTRLPKPAVRRRLRLGRAARGLAHAERAWLAGDIDGAHVAALSSASSNFATSLAMLEDEVMLVGHASILRFADFTKALAYWRQHVDPDGAEKDAAAVREGRRVDLSQTWKGAWRLDGWLDPVSGTIVSDELRRIEKELFEADWKEARERLQREPALTDLRRTAAQRRADALVEMAVRARSAPPGSRRPAPRFTVVMGSDRFKGVLELADGTVVTPGALVPFLTDAEIERILFEGPSRVIDVGRRQRLFSGALRRALEVRDRECVHELCDEPGEGCQGDHVDRYADGGETTQDNGRLACPFHNRLRNDPAHGP